MVVAEVVEILAILVNMVAAAAVATNMVRRGHFARECTSGGR
uniref:Uncharacterized protein n=1 Tax=Solanum lycopersicum TaxID=4081 RepID=A0A3Q7J530_SOLLC